MSDYKHPGIGLHGMGRGALERSKDSPGRSRRDTTAYDQGHISGAVGWNWRTQLPGQRPARSHRPVCARKISSANPGSPTTPPSSSTATITTGSPPTPSGSSSIMAIRTFASSTAAAKSGWRKAPPAHHQLPKITPALISPHAEPRLIQFAHTESRSPLPSTRSVPRPSWMCAPSMSSRAR